MLSTEPEDPVGMRYRDRKSYAVIYLATSDCLWEFAYNCVSVHIASEKKEFASFCIIKINF